MDNLSYRESRGIDKPCTAIVLPIGNWLIRNRVYDSDVMCIIDIIQESECPHCGYESDINDKVCVNCLREKEVKI